MNYQYFRKRVNNLFLKHTVCSAASGTSKFFKHLFFKIIGNAII